MDGNASVAAALGQGLGALVTTSSHFADELNSLQLPVVKSLGSALGNPSPVLGRIFGEGAGAFALSTFGSSVVDLQAVRGLLDGLDNIPNNVILTQTNGNTRLDINVHKPLTGTANFDLSVLGGAFAAHGNVAISADVDVHLTVGVDNGGFYIDVSDAQPVLVVSNLHVAGDVTASGAFGLVAVGLQDTTLDANVQVALHLHETADPLGGPNDGLIRPWELSSAATLNAISVDVAGSTGADVELQTRLVVGLGGVQHAFPEATTDRVHLSWADIANPTAVQITGIDAITDLVHDAEDAVNNGLAKVETFLGGLDSSAPLNTPISLLPIKQNGQHESIADRLQVGAILNQRLVTPIRTYFNSLQTGNPGELRLPTIAGLKAALQAANAVNSDSLALSFGPGFTLGFENGVLSVHFPFTAERTLPVELDLGIDAQDIGLAVTAEVNAALHAAFALDLTFGVDFSQLLSAPANAFFVEMAQPPTISAEILDTGGQSLSLKLGTGALSLGIHADVNGTVDTPAGNALFAASVGLAFNDPNGDNRLTLSDLSQPLSSLFGFAKSAQVGITLPLSISLGDNSFDFGPDAPAFAIETLTDEGLFGAAANPLPAVPTGSTAIYLAGNRLRILRPDFQRLLNLSVLFGALRNPDLFLSGLDTMLAGLQAGLNSEVASKSFPLIGNKLQDGAQFIEEFRAGIFAKVQQKIAGTENGIFGLVQEGLYELFGPANLNILRGPNGETPTNTSSPADFVGLSYPGDGSSVQFDLNLHQDKQFEVPFDLSLPGLGLGLDATGAVRVDMGWDLRLGFGIDVLPTPTFFFVTANPDDAPELKLQVSVTTPGLDVGGELGFLGVQATDGANESRTVTLGRDPQGNVPTGTFQLTFRGQTTIPLAVTATAQQVENALKALSNIGNDDIEVRDPLVPPTGTVGGPYTIVFKGALGNSDVAPGDLSATLSGNGRIAVAGAVVTLERSVPTTAVQGNFTLNFRGITTSALSVNASAAQVKNALQNALHAAEPLNTDTFEVLSPLTAGGPYTVVLTSAAGMPRDFGPGELTASNPTISGKAKIERAVQGGTTSFNGTFTVDLVDPDTTAPDERLTVQELAGNANQVFQPTLQADANVKLHLDVGFSGMQFPGLPSGLSAATFPSIGADFHVGWLFRTGDADLRGSTPAVSFEDVKLDLGSFFSDFVAPIVENIQKVTQPLQPIIDALKTEIPVLGDLGVHTTFLDFMTQFIVQQGYQDPRPFVNAIDALNNLDVPANVNFTLPLGRFQVTDPRSSQNRGQVAGATTAPGGTVDAPNSAIAKANGPSGGFFTRVKNALSGFSFPILENPSDIFALLTGNDPGAGLTLFTYSVPQLTNAGFTFDQTFPIVAPFVSVGLGGFFTLKADLKFGYDTDGLHKFFENGKDNPLDLLDGFYVSDRKNADGTGPEVPELTFRGNLHANLNLGVDLQAAKVVGGVEGGVEAFVYFDLNDPNQDGKIRLGELKDNFLKGIATFASDPVKAISYIFDIQGNIDGYLKLFVKAEVLGVSVIPGYPQGLSYPIARESLYEFSTGTLTVPTNEDLPLPPVADFDVVGSAIVNEGDRQSDTSELSNVQVGFTNQVGDYSGATYSYLYDFDNDGSFDPAPDAATVYLPRALLDDGPGTYTIRGRIEYANGPSLGTEYTTTITVLNVAPTATFGNTGPKPLGETVNVGFSNGNNFTNSIPSLKRSGAAGNGNDPNYTTFYGTTGVNAAPAYVISNGVSIPQYYGQGNGSSGQDVGKWFQGPNTASQGNQPSDVVSYQTTFSVDGNYFDLSTTQLRLDYTFWIEDYYHANNLLWNGGHSADVYLNGHLVGTAGVRNYGVWNNGAVPPGILHTYQVLELGQSNLAVDSTYVQNGVNTLRFTFKMGSGSFDPSFSGPGSRNASRAWFDVAVSSSIVPYAGQDPSGADADAGFRFSYDFNNDGDFTDATDRGNGTYAGSIADSVYQVPPAILNDGQPIHVVRGRILDKDGGYHDYYTTIEFVSTVNADAGGPYTIYEGQGLTLQGSGAGGFVYSWDLNNDGIYSASEGSNFSPMASLTWDQLVGLGLADGPHSFRITMQSAGFFSNVTSPPTTLTVLDTPPELTLGGSDTIQEGHLYLLSVAAPVDPGNDTVTHWNINWGDGRVDTLAFENGRAIRRTLQVGLDGQLILARQTILVRRVVNVFGVLHEVDVPVEMDMPVEIATDIGPATAYPFNLTHLYAADKPGYTISAVAVNEDGAFHSNTIPVRVLNGVPSGLNLSVSPNPVAEGSPITLTGSFTDLGPQATHTVTIDWDDGSPLEIINLAPGVQTFGNDPNNPLQHRYRDNKQAGNTYKILVTVTDDHGATRSKPVEVTVTNVRHTASIVGPAGLALEGSPVNLSVLVADAGPTDLESGYSISWIAKRVGSNSFTTGQGPDFTFTPDDEGIYDVRVTVLDKDAVTVITNTSIQVQGVAPTPTIVFPSNSVPEGTTVTVLSTISDPSSADEQAGFGYLWTVLGPNAFVSNTPRNQNSFTFTPNDNGNYQVFLLATDKNGLQRLTSRTIAVTNADPGAAIFGLPPGIVEGDALTLYAGGIDASSADWAAGFASQWTVLRQIQLGVFGTAYLPIASGSGPVLNFTPSDNGNYRIDLAMTDKDGGVGRTSALFGVANANPSVKLLVTAGARPEGTPIGVSSSVFDSGPDDRQAGYTYAWTVRKNGALYGSGSNSTPAFTPNDNGAYEIELSATDRNGGKGSESAVIVVNNVAPQPAIGGVPANAHSGTPIHLTASAQDPSVLDRNAGFTYAWRLAKDGVQLLQASGSAFTFTPQGTGNYLVTLAAFDKDGGTSFTNATVAVTNEAPSNLVLNATPTLDEGQTLILLGTFSDADPEDTHIVNVTWGDGDMTELTLPAGVFEFNIPHQYADNAPGSASYPINVTVTDSEQESVVASKSVLVRNVAPNPAATGFGGAEGSPLTISGFGFDESSVDQAAGFTFAWTIFKDGHTYATGSGPQITFTPDDNVGYEFQLAVIDKDGGQGPALRLPVFLANLPPSAAIAGAPATGPEGTPISLTASATDASTADQAAGFTFTWTVTKDGQPYATGSGAGFTFTPNDNGSYSAQLTTTDKDGGSTTETAIISVTNVAPNPAATGFGGVEGSPLTISGFGFDESSVDQAAGFTFAWTIFKDGHTYATGSGPQITFTPDDNVGYEFQLAVTDKDGGQGPALRLPVFLANLAPSAAIAGAPATSLEGTPIPLTASATDPSTADQAAGFSFAWTVTKDGQPYVTGSGTNFTFTPNDNGAYSVQLTATDKDGDSTTKTAVIAVTNVAPTPVIIGASTTSPEGTAISLGSSVSDPGSADTQTFAWKVTKNGSPYQSGAGAGFTFTPNDNGVYQVTLSITDDDGGATATSKTVNVTNVAPTITAVTGPASVVRGQEAAFTGSFTDPGSADTHTTAWRVLQGNTVVTQGAGTTFHFTPTVRGSYSVVFTVTDDDGGTQSATQTLIVAAVALQTDPLDPTKQMLVVGGTTGDDLILVTPGLWSGQIVVTILSPTNCGVELIIAIFSPKAQGCELSVNVGGMSLGISSSSMTTPPSRIVIDALAGDDVVNVSNSLSLPAWIYGSAGNDCLNGGNGNNVILGGAGNDSLQGGNGRDLLIGGLGCDELEGEGGQDILIGGTTAHDANAAALSALMAEWSRTDLDTAARVAHLNGSTAGGRNGAAFLKAQTIYDDGVMDELWGGNDADWFLYESSGSGKDKLKDRKSQDFATAL